MKIFNQEIYGKDDQGNEFTAIVDIDYQPMDRSDPLDDDQIEIESIEALWLTDTGKPVKISYFDKINWKTSIERIIRVEIDKSMTAMLFDSLSHMYSMN